MTAQPGEWPPVSPAKARLLVSPGTLKRKQHDRSSESGSEDEETLKLKLAHIEARLKLKQVQKKKRKTAEDIPAEATKTPSKPSPPATEPSNLQISPSRVQLGVDKGMTAKDVSLRRPYGQSTPEKPTKTFAQRLAELRAGDKDEQTRRDKVLMQRSKAFAPLPFRADAPKGGLDATIPTSQISSQPQVRSISAHSELYDAYSGFKMTNRLLPHSALSHHFAGKKIYDLVSILKEIVPPTYDPPEVADWVLLGIIAHKSEAREAKRKDGNKYLVLTITDLNYEITLFLFGDAFQKFWKLQLGHIIGILNPTVMKPQSKDSTKWCVKVSEAQDVILDIGRAKDLQFCQSLKKDGTQCGQWVDGRRTEYCEYHVSQDLKRYKSRRTEVAIGTKGYSPKKKSVHFVSNEVPGRGHEPSHNAQEAYSGTLRDDDNLSNVQIREHIARHNMVREKERQVSAKIVGTSGGGIGEEYLRKSYEMTPPEAVKPCIDDGKNPFSANVLRRIGFDPTKRVEKSKVIQESLGITGDRTEARLSPVKNRAVSQQNKVSSGDQELEIIM